MRKIHYLSGAMYVLSSPLSGESEGALYYTYTDNQGSLIALIDQSGTLVERYAYDPWGARRNPDYWEQKDSCTSWITNSGYTGHEHLDAFGVINMNGRVYDPVTASFLSPDPFIQSPGDWVNYNRYSYCMGNPMRYTDPSGYVWDGVGADGMTNEQWINYWYEKHLIENGQYAMYEANRQMIKDRQDMATYSAQHMLNGVDPNDVAYHYEGVDRLGYDHLYIMNISGQPRLVGSIGGEVTGIKDRQFVTTNNGFAAVIYGSAEVIARKGGESQGGNTPTISLKDHHEVDLFAIKLDGYGVSTLKQGNTNSEIVLNSRLKIKETEISHKFGGLVTVSKSLDGGNSIGLLGISLGENGDRISVDIAQQIPFTSTVIGLTITFNPLLMVPVEVFVPETRFLRYVLP